MFKLKTVAAAAGLMVLSGSAFAGTTANIAAGSSYMFRGIPQTTGAAISGGIDYAADSGVYAGLWASNVSFGSAEGGGGETDLYAGYAFKAGDIGLDVGAIGYLYTETPESATAAGNLDFAEVYVGVSFGPVSAKVYYSPDFGNFSSTGLYGTVTGTFPVNDTVSVFAQMGATDIDGGTTNYTDSYIDYSLGVTKTADAGLSFTLAAYTTSGRVTSAFGTGFTAVPFDDEPKIVVSAKKSFGL